MTTLFILLSLLIASANGQAIRTSIFVSPDGDDGAAGNKRHPVATLTEAYKRAASIQSPVEINISEGTYTLIRPLVITKSNIVFRGAGMDKTILSGGRILPPFTAASDSLWTIDLQELMPSSGEIEQLFINGSRATRARTPNGGKCFLTGAVTETIIDEVTDKRPPRQGFAVQEITMPDDAYAELKRLSSPNPEQLKIEVYHAWDMTRRYVESFNQEDSLLTVSGIRMHSWNPMDRVSQFRLTDDIAFLDEPGEWFYDAEKAMLYYIPRDGETIENAEAVIPSARQLVIIQGEENAKVRNISFEGISFQNTRFTMSRRGDVPQQGGFDTDASVMVDFAENISFTGCEIAHTGNNGIWLREGCSDCLVSHCYLHDLGIGAVKIGKRFIPENEETCLTKRITIENNILRDGGHEFPQGEGVMLFHTSDNIITHNEICDFYYTGISVGWVWGYSYSPSKRNEISYNHIHHLGWGLLSDMGGVYTLGESEGTVVAGNVIHHIHSLGYGGWGLYTDEGSTGIVMENNLIHHCKCSSFHQHYGKENIIRNNIMVDGLHAQLEATRLEDHLSYSFTGNIISYKKGDMYGINWEKPRADVRSNLYWHEGGEVSFNGLSIEEWQKTYDKDIDSIIADPLFKDAANGDYTPTNKEALDKIGFQLFDFSEAGVYGEQTWKELSRYDASRAELFTRTVEYYENNVPIFW